MRCRHTVPDWHRFVAAGEGAAPIFAACRLLTKDGDRVSDTRSIACAYWGHQEDCPLYEGPGKRPGGPPDALATPVSMDEATGVEDIWPVRQPGATDGARIILIALSALSAGLLIWMAILSMTAPAGFRSIESFRYIAAIGVTVSIVTHILALLRIWARR